MTSKRRLVVVILGSLLLAAIGYRRYGVRGQSNLEELEASPGKVVAGSPDTLVSISVSVDEPGANVTANGRPIAATRVGPFRIIGLLPAELLNRPGRITVAFGRSKPASIEVLPQKHLAELRLDVAKISVTSKEPFPISITLTNRAAYPLYVPHEVQPLVSGSIFSVYHLEVTQISTSPVFYPVEGVNVTGGHYATLEQYVAGGFVIRLEPGASLKQNLDGLVFEDLIRRTPLKQMSGIHSLRVRYDGFFLPPNARGSANTLDEILYSNPIEITVSE